MTNLVLTRRAGDCVRLETQPGEFRYLTVAYVGGDQIKLEYAGSIGAEPLTKRLNVGDDFEMRPHVKVRVISINFRNVKLGFDAPLSVKIVRTELLERAGVAQ